MNVTEALGNLGPFDGGDPSGMVFDHSKLLQHGSAVLLAREIGTLLERCYALHRWFIEVDNRGGIVKIWAGTCSGEYGYILKLEDVQRSPGALKRAVVKAGGEILERFRQPVGAYNREAWLAAPRDINGNLKPDISDKPARTRRRARDAIIDQAVKDGTLEFKHTDEGGVRHLIVRDGRGLRDET